MKTSTAVTIIIVLIVLFGAGWWYYHGIQSAPAGAGAQPTASVDFACDAGKSIGATFYEGSSTPSADATQPPTPGGQRDA